MKTKPLCRGVLALAILLSSSLAQADEPAPTAVVEADILLKSGERAHGELISIEPGKHVILLINGEQQLIPWDNVAKIISGPKDTPPHAAPPTPTPTPATPTPATTAPPTEPTKGMPFLHVESDWPEVELHRVDGEIGAGSNAGQNQIGPQVLSKYICEAPCNKLVDGREGNRFFFSAPGMMPSRHFRLEQQDGHITARIHGVSVSRFISGILLTTTGSLLALSGTLLFGFSFIPITPTPQNPNPEQAAKTPRTAGLIISGIGSGMLAGGIALIAGGPTKVEILKNNRGKTTLSFDGTALRF